MTAFKVGDVVVCTYPFWNDEIEGETYSEFIATIVSTPADSVYGWGVKVHLGTGHLDEYALHDLRVLVGLGNGTSLLPEGGGWWLSEDEILKHYEPPMMEYDPAQQGDTEDDI